MMRTLIFSWLEKKLGRRSYFPILFNFVADVFTRMLVKAATHDHIALFNAKHDKHRGDQYAIC
jgi:hypothetical protein